MAKINPALLDAIMRKTGLSRAPVYARIKEIASTEFLPRHLAAIRVAADFGVTINKYASSEELAQLRTTGAPVAPPAPVQMTGMSEAKALNYGKKASKRLVRKVPNAVFVVHGRDLVAKDSMFTFLRSVGVRPIEWTSAIAMTKRAAPYVGQILDEVFSKARAILVLMTPDDLAQLRPDLLTPSDKPYERILMGQSRPNVLFEAGMAFATHPDRTVIVQLGSVRDFSDIGGRHVVHMTNEFAKRQELAIKLKNAGCDVDQTGTDWVKAGDFIDPQSRVPKRKKRR
jgi:predicted nucleotide-binding protein